MSISSSKHKKYFSLIDKSYFPSLLNQNDSKDYIKATLSLVKKNKFIYLDMNASNLYFKNKLMDLKRWNKINLHNQIKKIKILDLM